MRVFPNRLVANGTHNRLNGGPGTRISLSIHVAFPFAIINLISFPLTHIASSHRLPSHRTTQNLASTKKIWDLDETSNSNAASTNSATNSSLNNSTTVVSQKQAAVNKQGVDDGQVVVNSTNGASLNASNVVVVSQNPQTSTDPLFLSDSQWRNEPGTWATNASDHAVSQPIMMQRSGSFPGLELSPRSGGDNGPLGLKMVEYLLDSSPTTKDIDLRMSRIGLNDNPNNLTNNMVDASGKQKKLDKESLDSSNTNGNLIQNGVGLTNGTGGPVVVGNSVNGLVNVVDDLDDNKSFNKTPGGPNLDSMMINGGNNGLVDDQVNKLVNVKGMSHSAVSGASAHLQNNLSDQISNINGAAGNADSFVQNHMFQSYQDFDNAFTTTMDSLQFDYQMMGAIDSAGGILDYGSQLYGQRNPGQQPPQSNQPGIQTSTQQQPPQLQHHQQQMQMHQQPPQIVPNQNPQQNPTNPFPQNYYQDPYAAQMGPHMIPTGPPMMQQPAYYGLPAWVSSELDSLIRNIILPGLSFS